MIVAIVGGRDFENYQVLCKTLDTFRKSKKITTIVSGGARGADALAEKYANENKIKLIVYKPDWNKHGKAAGPIRNKKIVFTSNFLIAFWDGKSRGTANSLRLAKQAGLPIIEIKYKSEELPGPKLV